MNEDRTLPVREFDLADELAAVNRFRLIQELEPAFYEKNWQSVCFINAVVSGLAQECDDLPLVMRTKQGSECYFDALRRLRGRSRHQL